MPDDDRRMWSNTRIELYQRCPKAYALRYIDKEPGVATDAMLTGRDFHEALERYGVHCYKTGKRSVKRDWDEARHIAAGYPDIQNDLDFVLQDIEWDWGSTLPGNAGPVEIMYDARLPNDEWFRGRIDLLQRYEGAAEDDPFHEGSGDLWIVTDWKSGWSRNYDREQAPFQLLAYAWLVQQNFPDALNLLLRIETLRGKSPDPWRLFGPLDWAADRLVGVIDRILADREFQPNVGPACVGCLMASSCPHSKSIAMQELTQDAAKVSCTVLTATERKDLGQKLLKAQFKESGPVLAGDGLQWGWTEKDELRCASPQAFVELMTVLEQDPWPYLSVTPANLRKAMAGVSETDRTFFDDIAEKKMSRSFGLQPVTGEGEELDDDTEAIQQ